MNASERAVYDFFLAVGSGDADPDVEPPEVLAIRQANAERLEAPTAMAGAAMHYAEMGVDVFPLTPGGKTPVTSKGFYDASHDTAKVERWWRAFGERFNIGAPTGRTFDVIDFDGYGAACSAGPDGLERLFDQAIGIVLTPRRGGLHLYMPALPDLRFNSTGRIAPGVDTRGTGGYTVLPPSVTDGRPGTTAGRYIWLRPMGVR